MVRTDNPYVVITTLTYYKDVRCFLLEHSFPENHIFYIEEILQDMYSSAKGTNYFEFPEFFKPDTAFVDAGCYDGLNSAQFVKMCGGKYSEIIALEPDHANYTRCQRAFEEMGFPHIRLIEAGLSDSCGTASFVAGKEESSHFIHAQMEKEAASAYSFEDLKVAKTVTLDGIINRTVGMIKMDIEGAELDALRGAAKTIIRDKPHLAICVYHLQGDMLAIMDYLHKLVPEYRFWLRHYFADHRETVLYAAV